MTRPRLKGLKRSKSSTNWNASWSRRPCRLMTMRMVGGFWVHFPILRLVFGDQQDPDTQPDEHAVVPEAIAFAGMVKACVPQFAPDRNGLYACSYKETSTSGVSSEARTWNSARELANSGKPGGGRKVDYALLLQCRRDSQLHVAISQACFSLQSQIGGKSHVNETDYQKIQFKPIAVAIEAKRITAGGDRVVQLGLWTAAWHARMEQFRMLQAQPTRVLLQLEMAVGLYHCP
ncbi:uncharacterized protein B0T15DRAFT_69627 [Chaetomium strumarium]|uniref:PD-(D/E)XK nuclease-like domain-containing protein n=1 Tax=Chaetomium strumarium TaxID=1170767 RepID=A0AAJ0M716_9PEZI|nr:hypothetical protein B0T15DRAFT_69627 [Chaetomium strumarium]